MKSFSKKGQRLFLGVVAGVFTLFGFATLNAQVIYEDDFAQGWIYKISLSGTSTQFYSSPNSEPTGLAVDSSGDLFVANNTSNTTGYITEITPGGTASTFASGLNSPYSLAFNSAGNLFVSSFNGGTITEIPVNANGTAGTSSTYATGLSNPYGIAFNSAGLLFAASGDSIAEIATNGTVTTFLSGSPPQSSSFVNYPFGLTFNSAGNLLFSNINSATITVVPVNTNGTAGTPSNLSISPALADPVNELAFLSNGVLLASSRDLTSVFEISTGGALTTLADNSNLGGAYGLAVAQAVPEPSTWVLALVGIAGLGLWRRFRALV